MVTSTNTSGSWLRCSKALMTVVAIELSDRSFCSVSTSSLLSNSLIKRHPFFCIAVGSHDQLPEGNKTTHMEY